MDSDLRIPRLAQTAKDAPPADFRLNASNSP
jgi:hypothetical protein